jgi:site-specific recombinase XerD
LICESAGFAAKSCNDYIAGMNSFFKWLHENEYVKELFKIQRMKEEKKVLRRRSVEIETTKIYLDVEVEELRRVHHKTSLMVELPDLF